MNMFGHRRRGKLNLACIKDASTRRTTFAKRSKSLFKKLSELNTLCDVKVCAVVYNPEDNSPRLFPDDPLNVLNVISDFRKLSVTQQKKKMLDQEDYLRERIKKSKEQLFRLRMENHERKLTKLMYAFLADNTKNFDNLSLFDLHELSKLIDHHLRGIEHHLRTFDEGLSLPYPVIPAGSEEISAIDPSILLEPTGFLPSPSIMNMGNNVRGEVFTNDFC